MAIGQYGGMVARVEFTGKRISAGTVGHGGHVPPLLRTVGPRGHSEQNSKQEIAK